jgi:NitT/TauT family transport system ATP-binding protein
MEPKGVKTVIDVDLERPRDKEKLLSNERYRTLRMQLVKLFSKESEEQELLGGAGI